MVANIDDWLFRLADNRMCEPEEKDCKVCLNKSCVYWADYNKKDNMEN